ncbi:MAG: ImmA/IrrE family metallo-endopeptidase [Rectinemataceae bacterium]
MSVGIDRAIADAEANRQLTQHYPVRPINQPVDPFAIAASCGIIVQPMGSRTPGISGCLMLSDGNFGILYAGHLPNDGYRRFTVAHELGHYFLEGHLKKLLATGSHSSHDDFGAGDPFERQANRFASSLLMPEPEFSQALWDTELDISGVRSLAERFNVSLTAAAIRMAELSEKAVAIVVSSGMIIEYCVISKVLEEVPRLKRPARSEALSHGTATFRLNKRIQQGDSCSCLSDTRTLDDWFEGIADLEVTEEALHLGSYGKTLTIISCDEDLDELMEDEE